MKISLIIPVLNEAKQIPLTLERLNGLSVDEVLFVDGGSTDATQALIQTTGYRLLSSSPGRGQQLRTGADQAAGNLLLFLHADNALHPDGIEQLRVAAGSHSQVWGGFEQQIEHQSAKYRWLEWGNRQRVRWWGLVYGDQGLFVSKSLYDQVGGMPAQPLMEDLEISRRLNRITRPLLLPGPHYVSPRRWEERGVIRQTLKNWSLVLRYRWGTSAEQLNSSYRRHDLE